MIGRRALAVVILDLLVLAELCLAVYFASKNAAEFTAVFLKVFSILVVPTFVLWRIWVARFCEEKTAAAGR